MLKTAIAAGFATCLTWAGAMAADIGGTYDVRGTNFDGSRYGGTAKITITSGNTCRIVWDTGSIAAGICMRNGPAFAASYVMGNSVGLVIYRLLENGSLEGLWTIADTDGVGTELLVPR